MLNHMKRLSIVLALLLTSCQPETQKCEQPVETPVDHKSISVSIKFTLHRDVNHIGKSSLDKILTEELLQAQSRINSRLSKSGLPQGRMNFEKK